MKKVLKEDKFKDVVAFRVNFDRSSASAEERALVKQFGIQKQSTLMVLKNGKDTSQLGLNTEGKIRDFLASNI